MEQRHDRAELQMYQSLSLEQKIALQQQRIKEWYEAWEGNVYVSFSGGKDSTVLLNLVRDMYPEVPAVFCDTGLEYPEIREFVKTFENVTWLKPKMNFRQVIQTYGYPVVSKEVSNVLQYAKSNPRYMKKLNGELLGPDGKLSQFNYPKWKFLLDAPFKISAQCCAVMKKRPFHSYEKEIGKKSIVATMACESLLRRKSWIQYGCNAFDRGAGPQSRPMSFWTEQDVLEYLTTYQVPYCSVYGEITNCEGGGLQLTGCDRTGCMFCMYGCHKDKAPNRFQRMKITHPTVYQYCMKPWEEGGLGLDEVLTYINVEH